VVGVGRLGRERWEALCRRCGHCCYQKEIRGGRVLIDYDSPCMYLDESSGLCTVYETRFSRCGDCRRMTVFHAIFASYLPADCGYVRRFRPWRKKPEACLERD
jgi:uncharacterized cysteine cluster protein YcgN (CxxCxxCC family)